MANSEAIRVQDAVVLLGRLGYVKKVLLREGDERELLRPKKYKAGRHDIQVTQDGLVHRLYKARNSTEPVRLVATKTHPLPEVGKFVEFPIVPGVKYRFERVEHKNPR